MHLVAEYPVISYECFGFGGACIGVDDNAGFVLLKLRIAAVANKSTLTFFDAAQCKGGDASTA